MKELTLNQSLSPKKEYKGIDIFKMLMAIIVVASHTKLYSGTDPFFKTIYELILSCVVPFFFIASGFFLYKEKDQEEKLFIGLKKIVKLYVIWSIIYFPIAIYDYVINDVSILKAIFSYIRGFFFVGEHYLSWPLWYLLAFIYGLIGILILKKLKLNDKQILIISLIIYIFGNTMTFLVNNYNYFLLVRLFQMVFFNGRLFTGMFLIFFGMYIKQHNIMISKLIVLLLIVVCFTISVLFPNEITNLILYVSIFMLSLQINNININTINLRKSSTIFYFLHMLNLFIFMLIVGENNVYGFYGFLVNSIICLIESIIIIGIQNKYNFNFINELFNWSSKK